MWSKIPIRTARTVRTVTVFVIISCVCPVWSWRWQRGQCIGSLSLSSHCRRLTISTTWFSPSSPSSPRSMKSLLSSSQGSLVLCCHNPTLLISVSSQWLLFYKLSGFVVVRSPQYRLTIFSSENLQNALRIPSRCCVGCRCYDCLVIF